jgi:hypothetical protein
MAQPLSDDSENATGKLHLYLGGAATLSLPSWPSPRRYQTCVTRNAVAQPWDSHSTREREAWISKLRVYLEPKLDPPVSPFYAEYPAFTPDSFPTEVLDSL